MPHLLGGVTVPTGSFVHLAHEACIALIKDGIMLEGRNTISRVMSICNSAAMSVTEALVPKLPQVRVIDVVDGIVIHLKTLFCINLMTARRDKGLCEGLPILI